MFQIYDQWPKLALESYNKDLTELTSDKFDHIVFVGMGGSGTIGDIFSSILSKSGIHVSVVKGYILPKTVNSNTLVIPISISGNTQETFTILKSALEKQANIISFSSNGKLEEFCKINNIEFRKIIKYHSSRASLVNFLYGIFKVLNPILPITSNEIINSISELEKLREKINSKNLSEKNPALELATWITKTPIIYYPYGLESVAIRFKNSMQENAKTHVMTEDIIEACHNGVVAWNKKSNFQPILIQGKDDHFKTKQRW